MTHLFPAPRALTETGGAFELPRTGLIALDCDVPATLRFSAHRLREAAARAGCEWEIVAGPSPVEAQTAVTLRVRPGLAPHPQGYRLTLAPGGSLIEAGSEAGVFYGVCTLAQILHSPLRAQHIEDWPDFPARGVLLDISRDKVPTLETLFALVDRLAGWKINQLQLYTEHTFAYRRHPEVWAEASPLTGQDILDLDAYCRERFIELVPNQNSFGHMQRWLKHPRYAPLAETHGEYRAWGQTWHGPFGLCPTDPGSLALLRELYDELLPHFTSRLFNVGCDETVDLGQGRSRAVCAARGTGRVYLDFVLDIYREVKARGRTLQFWGDIVLQHPELIHELPKDAIALEWGYEADHPFDEHGACFAAAGVPFYVCPGTSAWNSLAGRTHNALRNLRRAAEAGRRCGAAGYLITDWGDNGHWQMLPVSYLGLAAGAAYAWGLTANGDLDVASAVSAYAFDDASGALGTAAFALGNVYRAVGLEPRNASVLFEVMQSPLAKLRQDYAMLTSEDFARALAATEAAEQLLAGDQCRRPDAALVRREMTLTVRFLRHAGWRGQWACSSTARSIGALRRDLEEIMDEYQALWRARNRPGGLPDSLARFAVALADYGQP